MNNYRYFVLVVSSGFLFGFLKGIATVLPGCAGGALLGFYLSRYCMKNLLTKHIIQKRPTLKIILSVIDDHSIKVAFLIRMVPIPFGISNAVLGLSTIPIWKFMLGTVAGLLPFQLAFLYMGSTARSLAEVVSGDAESARVQIAIFVCQGVLTLSLTSAIVYIVRRVLRKATSATSHTILRDQDDDNTEESELQNLAGGGDDDNNNNDDDDDATLLSSTHHHHHHGGDSYVRLEGARDDNDDDEGVMRPVDGAILTEIEHIDHVLESLMPSEPIAHEQKRQGDELSDIV
eukprot:TRINITY_DN14866_c0_g1_i1.p1 TRINITY_DN14866_c0_g1~~TRINITY_DN14866_c0_g1_i1.p1  ORF type:complete len:289 (+),score=50.04 TRINITY_DN14866_c0_g1_i1:290-1156(+)